jgi:uncharacterized protein (DUF2062 family)
MLVALALAAWWRLNKALVIIAANISIPPVIPLIIYLSFVTGRMYVAEDATWVIFSKELTIDSMKQNLFQYITGAVTLAVIAGLLAGMVTYLLLSVFRKKRVAVNQ